MTLFTALVVLAAAAGDAGTAVRPQAHAVSAPEKTEVGALVLDGVPEIPQAIRQRAFQYQNTRSASFADWVKDGLLIRTRFGEAEQIHHVAGPGQARRQLTFYKDPVAAAVVLEKHPGGFLFLMDEGGSEFHQLYWLDRKSGRHQLLTDGKSRNVAPIASHAGDRFAFASNARNGTDMDLYLGTGPDPKSIRLLKEVQGSWTPLAWSRDDKHLLVKNYRSVSESHLHVLDVEKGTMTEVNPTPGKKVAHDTGVFAPDGKSVFYTSDEDSDFLRLVRQDLASGKKQVLTSKLAWDVEHLALSADGKTLAYVVNEDGKSSLYFLPTSRGAGPRKINLPLGVMREPPKFDASGRRLALGLSVSDATRDVFVVDVASGKVTRWTQSELGGLNPDALVTPELVRVASFDGLKIPAWYYRPRATTGGRPVPVVITIHGGPEAQERAGLTPLVQMLVNELGVAVLAPNVRGSTGYGRAYSNLDNAEKREDSVRDIGALLDWIGTQPGLDAKRVAVFGGSYGGYMVLASLASYPERLKAGVDVVGISNFVTFLESTKSYRRDLRRAEYGDERDPKMRQHLEAISPTTRAGRIRDPLFVVQGLNDPRVPVTEAEQMVRAVRKSGVPVWYLLAKDEGHGFRKKTNSDFLYASVAHFLQTHLVGDAQR